jgi:hypothetical protein
MEIDSPCKVLTVIQVQWLWGLSSCVGQYYSYLLAVFFLLLPLMKNDKWDFSIVDFFLYKMHMAMNFEE